MSKKKKELPPLTDRQKELFNYIYEISEKGEKVSQWDIYTQIGGYTWNSNPFIHDNCPQIWHDIARLNMENDKPIIITKDNTYWIGTKQETKEFLKKLWIDLAPRLCRHWRLVKKAKRNGQVEIDFDKELEEVFTAWRIEHNM